MDKNYQEDSFEDELPPLDFYNKNTECLEEEYDSVSETAKSAFGIKYLFPWQRLIIANILEGFKSKKENKAEEENDSFTSGRQIVLLPTGAGKSLCFLTPAILLDGPTMVLYPLLALMADQKRRMDEGGIKSVVFRGGQTKEEREENFLKIKEGAKIILANPEVLQNEKLLDRLSECNISHIAIDEAHCVSEWGDTFRPAYLTLGKVIEKINPPVVTAFTATASPQVLERVSQVLFKGNAHIVRSESDRPNIHYHVINTLAKKREVFRLAIRAEKPLIIFCGTRAKSEDMARELSAFYGKEKVRFYHAGMEKSEKTKTEKWFYPKKDAILCSTCAFGMGVDKKDIKTVIHLEASPSGEAYIQEAGRGGRDGSIANAFLVWNFKDSRQSKLKGEKFGENSRERVMGKFAESSTCRRQILLDALGAEKAACDGCDVCERGGKTPFAEDALFALKAMAFHRREWTKDGLISFLQKAFNKKDLNEFKMNIWETDDIKEIIEQLEDMHLIRKCIWPWNKKYTLPFAFTSRQKKLREEGKLYTSPFYERKIYKRLSLFFLKIEKSIFRIKNRVKKLSHSILPF